MFSYQHDATMLSNGHILVFDNGLVQRRSRVVELDPATNQIVWSWEREDLFSVTKGGAQQLPNGNVLITESGKGHCLEVTPSGEVVWEFWNDDLDPEKKMRGTIYRMRRLPLDFFGARLNVSPPGDVHPSIRD
jgi:outer membrane protein assembly factor BamB